MMGLSMLMWSRRTVRARGGAGEPERIPSDIPGSLGRASSRTYFAETKKKSFRPGSDP